MHVFLFPQLYFHLYAITYSALFLRVSEQSLQTPLVFIYLMVSLLCSCTLNETPFLFRLLLYFKKVPFQSSQDAVG